MFKFISVFIVSALMLPAIAGAAPKARQFESNAVDVSVVVPGTEGMTEMEVVSTLKHDIEMLDEELRTCERKRKGWVAATVVGGVGVVGTGVAAIVQGNKISEKKAEIKRIEGDISATEQDIKSANEKLEQMGK